MTQTGASSSEDQWRTRRRYARVRIVIPVEIYTKSTVGQPLIARINSLSVGGALACSQESFDLHTELAMLFQLPTGPRIQAFGRVVYSTPARGFGMAFIDLDEDARLHLEEFTQKTLGYARRSSRVPYHTHLIIQSLESGGGSNDEEPANTVLVSRNGGLLVCRATYNDGQKIYLWSPERQCGIRARVVFQRVWANGALVEVGFEFLADENFWNIDFLNEYKRTLE